MTDLKQAAMQQALEALSGALWLMLDNPVDEQYRVRYAYLLRVITALREALAQPVQEPVGEVTEVSDNGFQCEFNQRLAVGTKLYIAPPLPVQEPLNEAAIRKIGVTTHCQCEACKNGNIHDSDCSVHNGNALPVGPCNCSQTFISSPDLGIVVTVSFQLAVLELAKLVENNFGQMPRDEWADKVLLVRDTFEAARNKGAKP